jgi:hypothetical protein
VKPRIYKEFLWGKLFENEQETGHRAIING